MKSLLVLYSYHHNNTEKIARAMGRVLDAQIKQPKEIETDELQGYDLVGFGSGIYGAKHHKTLIDLADRLPQSMGRKAFLFSTFGAPAIVVNDTFISDNHSALREKLEAKGYEIIDEFGCGGFNTNSFLKLFGGLNKGRPNEKDLKDSREFASKLKEMCRKDR